MKNKSDFFKVGSLVLIIIFLIIFNVFWLDYLGLVKMADYISFSSRKENFTAIAQDEIGKKRIKLEDGLDDLARREAVLRIQEKKINSLERERNNQQNKINRLAKRILDLSPEKAVQLMADWDNQLVMDLIRELDRIAQEEEQKSLSPYLLSLLPQDRASKILLLLTKSN